MIASVCLQVHLTDREALRFIRSPCDTFPPMNSSTLPRATAILAFLAVNLCAQKPVLSEDFESGKIDPAVWDVRQKGGETIVWAR